MKLINTITVLFFGFFACVSFSEENEASNDIAKEVIETDSKLEQALAESDAKTVQNIYADDLVYVHVGATMVDNKEGALKWAALGYPDKYWKKEDIKVRVFGDIAELTGFLTVKKRGIDGSDDPAAIRRYHHLRIYIKKEERWQLLSQHGTIVVNNQTQVPHMLDYAASDYGGSMVECYRVQKE